MKFDVRNTFTDELAADPDLENIPRQVYASAYSFVEPTKPLKPQIVHVCDEVAELLGLSQTDLETDDFREVFSGAKQIPGSRSYAMCYGGHQFGSWAGQLGDGRAITIAQVNSSDSNWTLQLKGSGRTPYSRGADGLAVLRSSIREHLCSEAMFHLGVPTTRSLSLALSGDRVLRDIMYDGNSALEKGSIVCRVAQSFIRFGNFQIHAARDEKESLKQLLDYTISQHFAELKDSDQPYIEFFSRVSDLTLDMIIHWQRVGFVHGVMNTDNMSILGLTIDYGPYGWLEGYDPDWTPNTTDKQHRRYRFGNQPQIALWNLMQLANALITLGGEPKPFEGILNRFRDNFEQRYVEMMLGKLGLTSSQAGDEQLVGELEQALVLTETDMTIFFRALAEFDSSSPDQEGSSLSILKQAMYVPEELAGEVLGGWQSWFKKYADRLELQDTSVSDRKEQMNLVNPKYVLRNYMAQLAIDAADEGNYKVIEELHQLLKNPYSEQPENSKWFAKRPEWARTRVGCSMLSCSS